MWQRPRESFLAAQPVWYCKSPVGKNTLDSMMSHVSKSAQLSITYTNHCIRATTISTLDLSDMFREDAIMSVSGHKSRASISSYSTRISDQTKRQMAGVLFQKALGGPPPSAALGSAPSALGGPPSAHRPLSPPLLALAAPRSALAAPPSALAAPPSALGGPPSALAVRALEAPPISFGPFFPPPVVGADPPAVGAPQGTFLPYGPPAPIEALPVSTDQEPNLPNLDLADFDLSQMLSDVACWSDNIPSIWKLQHQPHRSSPPLW